MSPAVFVLTIAVELFAFVLALELHDIVFLRLES